MTQLEYARKGTVAPEMARVATGDKVRPEFMRIAAICLLMVAAATLSLGCGSSAGTPKPAGAKANVIPAGAPCIVIWHMPGNAQNSPAGLEGAIWPDGAFLAAADRLNPGQWVVMGMMDADDLAGVFSAVRDAGFFSDWESIVVVDAPSTFIRVRDGERDRFLEWTETLTPGVGGDISTDMRYREFVRMWRRTRAAIEGVAPISCELFEVKLGPQGSFRGYRLDKPWDTAWIPR